LGAIMRVGSEPYELPSHCLVGRSSACDLVLEARAVSAQHAIIQWIGGMWQVQDLGSLNGTFVNKHKLASGERVPLQDGDSVCFARELGVWRLVDTRPPRPIAMHLLSRRVHVAERGYLALPAGEHPALPLQLSGPGRAGPP